MALAGRGFLAWYNARLTSHPYSVKAFGTGATYVASDCTAQAIEGEKGVAVHDRAARSCTCTLFSPSMACAVQSDATYVAPVPKALTL